VLTDENEKFNPYVATKIIKLQFDNFEPGNEEYLLVKVEKNLITKPKEKPIQIKDYKYPEFKDGYFDQRYADFYESLLCRADFKYKFDFETSKVELINYDEVLIKIHEVLIEKGFNEKNRRREINRFIDNGIPLLNEIVQSIFLIPTGSFDKGTFEEYKTKLEVLKPKSILTQTRREKKVGLYSRRIESDQEKRHLLNLNTIEIDSTKHRIRSVIDGKSYWLRHREKDIKLKSTKNIGANRIKISGKIKNQKNKKVTLAWLKKPFGTELHQEVIYLDENNSFHFETELKHPQLLYIQFGHYNFADSIPMLALYAEPGSVLSFNAEAHSNPWEIEFLGDFKNTQNLIYNFRNKHSIFDEKFNLNSLFWYARRKNYPQFERALKDLENHFVLQIDTENAAIQFVKQEIKAQLMRGVVEYLRIKYANARSTGYYFQGYESVNDELLKDFLDSFDININFNEYGIHSRNFTQMYLSYHYASLLKTADIGFPEFSTTYISNQDFRYLGDLPLRIEFAKTILSGPALYSEIAAILFDEKMRSFNTGSQSGNYIHKKVDEYYDLMLRVSNDEVLNAEVKEIVATLLNWQNPEFVPDNKFYNPEGEEVHMKDFFGKKPTIFYISRDWAAERYYFDDLSVENPEINYVLIVEGSNFKEWTDYLKAAEPKANQLLLFSNEKHLTDIFNVFYRNFILYDENGIRIDFAGNPLQATNRMKHYLKNPPDKEINKSQLVTLIILLSAIVVLLILFFFFMKWRVRKRLRQEEQQRRLRELELTAIRSQMNPHFLFNCLNSVQNLVQQNKGREAHLYLADFAGLIRKVLQNSEKEEVSLAEELEMVQQYLNLEKLRFDFNFQITTGEGSTPTTHRCRPCCCSPLPKMR
jgi:hypothetical protein